MKRPNINHAIFTLGKERIELTGQIKTQEGVLEYYRDAKGSTNEAFVKIKRKELRKLKRQHDQISEAMNILNSRTNQ